MNKPHNPLAFPRAQFSPHDVGFQDAGFGNSAEDGMTLRDYFAAKIMQGMVAANEIDKWPGAAAIAYTAADFMLEARSK